MQKWRDCVCGKRSRGVFQMVNLIKFFEKKKHRRVKSSRPV